MVQHRHFQQLAQQVVEQEEVLVQVLVLMEEMAVAELAQVPEDLEILLQ
jgi:hypothetical protein